MGILTNLSLFSGAGGLDLGARKVGGFRTVGYVERDRYAQGVLMSRIRGGDLDDAPIHDDVTTFDGRPYRGLVDIVSGGFPCQDLSYAGKRAGIIEGKRSGLWNEYARIVGEVRPSFVLVENVPGLLADGALGVVLGDLAELGFDAEWARFGACWFGAPHMRERVFLVAYSNSFGRLRRDALEKCVRYYQNGEQDQGIGGKNWVIPSTGRSDKGARSRQSEKVWNSEPELERVVDGVADGLDRLRCCGNGVVPDQSVPAWSLIKKIAQGKIA